MLFCLSLPLGSPLGPAPIAAKTCHQSHATAAVGGGGAGAPRHRVVEITIFCEPSLEPEFVICTQLRHSTHLVSLLIII